MDKDGGNWTAEDIAEWEQRLAETTEAAPLPRPSVLRRLGRAVFRWLDQKGDDVREHGLSPYEPPRPDAHGIDFFSPDEPEDDTWHKL